MNIFQFSHVTLNSDFHFGELLWVLLAFMYEFRIKLGDNWNSGCKQIRGCI